MFEIKSLLEDTTKITFKYKDQDITVNVRTESMTPGVMADLGKLAQGTDYGAIADAVGRVLVSWEISYDGKPFPVSAENLRRVPMDFLSELLGAVTETWSGNEQTPSASASGSAA